MSENYDVIVVGVGAMGSSACYELANRGLRVLGLEQFDAPNERGSSHGETRIIRLAYYEDPTYVHLLRTAYERWRRLEDVSGQQLLITTGSLDIGPEDGPVFRGSRQSCVDHGLDHEILTAAEVQRRFPAYRLPSGTMACYQPDGGFLLPEQCIAAYVEAARHLGAAIRTHEPVVTWSPTPNGGVEVETAEGSYTADRLVITAGAWLPRLVPQLAAVAVPERQVLAWFAPKQPALFSPDAFPVFNLEASGGRYYGLPMFGIPGFKVGRYRHREEIADPDRLDREPNAGDEHLLRGFVRQYLPAGAGPTVQMRVCMFTNTPDAHFVVDVMREHPQVSYASACSGHGFKFASVIGEVLADLAQRGATSQPIHLFRRERFEFAHSSG